MKKIIPTHLHVWIDYGLVLTLLAGPFFFESNDGAVAKCSSVCSGAFLALFSFFTAYEGGIVRLIPMKIHLLLDILLGVFLMLAPWLLGFNGQTFLFHLCLGSMSVLAGMLTHPGSPTEFQPT